MQSKKDIYAEQIERLVREVTELCEEHDIASLFAACIGMEKKAHSDLGEYSVMMAGAANFDTKVPGAMLIAATILQIPGFDKIDMDEFEKV